MTGTKVAFLDRDGVINLDHDYVHTVEAFHFIDGALSACADLVKAGYKLIIVTNQSGIGRGYYSEDDFHRLCDWMKGEFEKAQAPITHIYFCPHHPEKAIGSYRIACNCRKPAPGMLLQAVQDYGIDVGKSLMVGDKAGDMTAARAAGVPKRILVGRDGLQKPTLSGDATDVTLNLREAVNLVLGEH